MLVSPAFAGPPYVTDDPEPTDFGHYEIYAFAGGTSARDGSGGAGGIDFNYGAAPDLQLTAVLPLAWDSPNAGGASAGLGNVELAAKYKFLHQDDVGVDVAFFPRVFLPGRVRRRWASGMLRCCCRCGSGAAGATGRASAAAAARSTAAATRRISASSAGR